MTWAEFMIRLHAFKRKEKRDVMMLRELAWVTYIAPHQDRKRLKKSKEAFWPIKSNNKKAEVTDLMRSRIKEAQGKFFKEQKLLKDAGK